MTTPSWEQRIRRSEELAEQHLFSGELLRFYKEILSFQQELFVDATHREFGKSSKDLTLDTQRLSLVLPQFSSLLALVERAGPARLVHEARELKNQSQHEWMNLLISYWEKVEHGPLAMDPQSFFARAFLQPYAEYLRLQTPLLAAGYHHPLCPFCSRRPLLGILRPEGEGAKRSLLCCLCQSEWNFRRIVCAACGHDDEKELPIYEATDFNYIRVEACDKCKAYLKTIDLTKNGLAVPIVDEIAAAPLDLWAAEQGYHKIELNLLGL